MLGKYAKDEADNEPCERCGLCIAHKFGPDCMAENISGRDRLMMTQLADESGIGAKCRRIGIHVCAVQPFLAGLGCLAGSAAHHRAPDIVFEPRLRKQVFSNAPVTLNMRRINKVAGYPSPNAHMFLRM
ncbi:MAG: hypothetical protein R3D34_04835 [Nitratireductor sp.]